MEHVQNAHAHDFALQPHLDLPAARHFEVSSLETATTRSRIVRSILGARRHYSESVERNFDGIADRRALKRLVRSAAAVRTRPAGTPRRRHPWRCRAR